MTSISADEAGYDKLYGLSLRKTSTQECEKIYITHLANYEYLKNLLKEICTIFIWGRNGICEIEISWRNNFSWNNNWGLNSKLISCLLNNLIIIISNRQPFYSDTPVSKHFIEVDSSIITIQQYHHYTAVSSLYSSIIAIQQYHHYTAVSSLYSSIITIQQYHRYTAVSSLYSIIIAIHCFSHV